MKLVIPIAAALTLYGACNQPDSEAAPGGSRSSMTTTSHGIAITRIDRIAIHYSYIGWNSSDRKVVIVGDGKRYVADKVEVPAPLVTQLMASLTDLVPSDAPKSCDDHTDDYPIFDIVLATDQGEVHVSSSSNCRDFAPWNVVSGGVLYFQASGAFGRALAPMLTAVDAKEWPAGRKIEPRTSRSFRTPRRRLAQSSHGRSATVTTMS